MTSPAAGQLFHDGGKVARVVQTGNFRPFAPWYCVLFFCVCPPDLSIRVNVRMSSFELCLPSGVAPMDAEDKERRRSYPKVKTLKYSGLNYKLSSGTLIVSMSYKATGFPCRSQRSSMSPNLKELTLGRCQRSTWQRRHKARRPPTDIQETKPVSNQRKKSELQVRHGLKKSPTDIKRNWGF